MILAGDLGGTNARLALFALEAGTPRLAWRASYEAREADWRALVRRARLESGVARLEAAAVAVAGPVEDGAAALTNLGWRVSAEELARELGLPRARLLNDLEAAAHGLLALASEDLAVLQTGEPEALGNRVLCSPGTGLGTGALVWDGARHHALASEGGHATFAPLDAEDRALGGYLAERHGHVSWERVLSGPGLVALYEFQRDVRGLSEPDELARALERGDGPAAITHGALEHGFPIAVRALERFAHLLGVASGNLALEFLARGGVYLGGGIPPRIRSVLEGRAFREGFLSKGRMRPLLERMRVSIVLNPDCALVGAARCAARDAGVPA
jgi:glucokinase